MTVLLIYVSFLANNSRRLKWVIGAIHHLAFINIQNFILQNYCRDFNETWDKASTQEKKKKNISLSMARAVNFIDRLAGKHKLGYWTLSTVKHFLFAMTLFSRKFARA